MQEFPAPPQRFTPLAVTEGPADPDCTSFSLQGSALPLLEGKASASLISSCLPLLIQAQPFQDQLRERNTFPQLHITMGQLLTTDTFPQGLLLVLKEESHTPP